ncbi:MAG: hypothetical protein PHT36_01565 [Patescibacteria group bacterium]|nr:hypothetical protein [Patescibacteria group bacterium]
MENRINTAEYIGKYKELYKKLAPVFSPAIGQKVYFNSSGFRHLIYKRGHRRSLKEMKNRLNLVPLIIPAIKNCDEEVEIRIRREIINGCRVRVTYYALESCVGKSSARVRVVTRKVGEVGRHYFQSIMKY